MKGSEKLGLGTVQFGLPYGISNKNGQTSTTEVAKILATAKSYEIEVLDSASAYGNSEEVLGKEDLSSFKVISKFMPESNRKPIFKQLKKSLESLGLNFLYGYLAHRPMSLLEQPGQWEQLIKFQKERKIKKIGFSLNEPEELHKLLDKGYIPEIVQVPFNYFDNRFEDSLILLKKMNCEIHTRSTFLQGLFFIEPDKLSSYFNEIKSNLRELQSSHENLSASLLNFVLNKDFIDKVIVGVENTNQLRENIEGLNNAKDLPPNTDKVSNNILNPSLWKK
ncbi:aldo/keto reductase [Salegentibacter sp. Hel_I_6]|uniref:aldo/keto reductase n=1 Tax=Salegentibacter sp. Hel_I_6 TaxID=1250278 RepID=UPI00055DE397|nr:aldo/keto reductase [Salegentibacter sp. Hel_I_6]